MTGLRYTALGFAGALALLIPTITSATPAAQGRQQSPVIPYPNPQIQVKTSGGNLMYRGLIYVSVFRDGETQNPVATAELGPSARDVIPLDPGRYEVRYAMREGSKLKTFIMRDVIIRSDRGSTLQVEMNGEAETTIIGGDMSAQEMADGVRALRTQVADLKQQLAKVKS